MGWGLCLCWGGELWDRVGRFISSTKPAKRQAPVRLYHFSFDALPQSLCNWYTCLPITTYQLHTVGDAGATVNPYRRVGASAAGLVGVYRSSVEYLYSCMQAPIAPGKEPPTVRARTRPCIVYSVAHRVIAEGRCTCGWRLRAYARTTSRPRAFWLVCYVTSPPPRLSITVTGWAITARCGTDSLPIH